MDSRPEADSGPPTLEKGPQIAMFPVQILKVESGSLASLGVPPPDQIPDPSLLSVTRSSAQAKRAFTRIDKAALEASL